MEHNKKQDQYSTLMIPVVVMNGILGGIVSVITSYFFKPIWTKLVEWYTNERKIS